MDVEVLGRLRSADGLALLSSLPPYSDATALAEATRLRSEGYDGELVAAALSQHRLRARATDRLGPDAARMWFTADGAEQATRPAVAERRARRFADAGVGHVADLGCGIGADSIALARAGIRVTAVERDPLTAAVASANAEELGVADLVTVVTADVADVIDGLDVGGIFVDPARRRGGRRLLDPEAWSPPFSWVVELANRLPACAAKVAPGIARDLPPDGTETEWVSVDGDLLEACVWWGPLARDGVARRATVLPAGVALTDADDADEPPPVGPVGTVLLEPDDAVIRAGLVAQVAHMTDGRLVDPTIAYVTCDSVPEPSPLWRMYAVVEEMPFNLKALRARLHAMDVGRVEIKKRGSAVEPETLRRQLRLDRDARGSAIVVLTRVAGRPTALLVSRVPT